MAKAILYKSKKLSDEKHPIVIRWYENGKQKVFTVGSCTEKQWNADKGQVKKSHPFADQINEKIKEHLGNAILDGGIIKDARSENLVEYIEKLRQKSEENGQLTVKNRYTALKNDLIEWGGSNYSFNDFTESKAERFYSHLINVTKNSKNTAAKKMSTISGVFKLARRNKLTLNDPVLNLSFPKTAVIKSKLTREELTLIEEVDLSGCTLNMQLARDSFVMQFYLRGIRVGDMLSLKINNIAGDRIVFTENKSGMIRSIPIRKEVALIIERYNGKGEYLIPLLRFEYDKSKTVAENTLSYKKSIESATAVININLKKIATMLDINKNITTHIARHTFAKIAFDTVKNIRISQELIGHKSLKVHQEYIKDLENTDELDQAADDVFG